MSNNVFRNRAVHEKVCKNIVEPGRSQMTIWRVRIACWIPKATNTPSEYVILLAFPLQQWLHERAYVIPTLPLLLTSTLLWDKDV